MADAHAGASPAHRPSRRHVVVDAAIRVFARKGFVATAIQDVAAEAGVVPNAVYYHFAGKEELFDAAFRQAAQLLSEAIDQAVTKAPTRPLNALADAIWDWLETHPDHGRILCVLAGSTSHSFDLWTEFGDHCAGMAWELAGETTPNRKGYSKAAGNSARLLSGRTLIGLLTAAHSIRSLREPPRTGSSARALRAAVRDVAKSLISEGLPVT